MPSGGTTTPVATAMELVSVGSGAVADTGVGVAVVSGGLVAGSKPICHQPTT
jgi:hypothetical protein